MFQSWLAVGLGSTSSFRTAISTRTGSRSGDSPAPSVLPSGLRVAAMPCSDPARSYLRDTAQSLITLIAVSGLPVMCQRSASPSRTLCRP